MRDVSVRIVSDDSVIVNWETLDSEDVHGYRVYYSVAKRKRQGE